MRTATLVLAVLATTTAAPAAATSGAVPRAAFGCDFTGTARFDPGLRLAPQQAALSIRATGTPCGEPDGVIGSATFSGRVSGRLTCTRPDGTPAGTGTVTWRLRDGRADAGTVAYALSGAFTGGAALDGTVVAGRGVGRAFHVDLGARIPEFRIACATAVGLTEATLVGRFGVT